MIKCKTGLVVSSITLALFGCLRCTLAQQQPDSIRRQVLKRLTAIKPKDTKERVYRIVAPLRPSRLPASLRLDLVYKIGHYQWSLVAFRFERKKDEPFVDVSQVVFRSALPFWKEAVTVTDSYGVMLGRLKVQEFDDLLSLAYALYKADIKSEYIGPANRISGSIAGSSGDGVILAELIDTASTPRIIMRESGTLAVGDLSRRVIGGFDYVRLHLFWEVFHTHFRNHPPTELVVGSNAAKLLISRLSEPPISDDYKDYFRLSLYVRVLAELGEPEATTALKDISEKASLKDNWGEYLREEIGKAIERIKAKN
jgi:hypothetical protein